MESPFLASIIEIQARVGWFVFSNKWTGVRVDSPHSTFCQPSAFLGWLQRMKLLSGASMEGKSAGDLGRPAHNRSQYFCESLLLCHVCGRRFGKKTLSNLTVSKTRVSLRSKPVFQLSWYSSVNWRGWEQNQKREKRCQIRFLRLCVADGVMCPVSWAALGKLHGPKTPSEGQTTKAASEHFIPRNG